jgi:exodeoxyribonuclease V alpha subunit
VIRRSVLGAIRRKCSVPIGGSQQSSSRPSRTPTRAATGPSGEVYNGDIGFIDDVDPDLGELTANFDGRTVTYGFGYLDTLVPAYAASIHKSQGSEYPEVVIPVMTQHYAMLQRNLLYTGVTRGKRLVVLVGQKEAVAIGVKNVSGRRRWSKLNEWLSTRVRSIQPSET